MAESKSTNKLPPRAVITDRVEEQRRRIWHAQAICTMTALAAKHVRTGADEAGPFAQDAWMVMEGVAELLGEVAGALEGDVVLDHVKLEERDHEEAQS
jgi:hypothetical protein